MLASVDFVLLCIFLKFVFSGIFQGWVKSDIPIALFYRSLDNSGKIPHNRKLHAPTEFTDPWNSALHQLFWVRGNLLHWDYLNCSPTYHYNTYCISSLFFSGINSRLTSTFLCAFFLASLFALVPFLAASITVPVWRKEALPNEAGSHRWVNSCTNDPVKL